MHIRSKFYGACLSTGPDSVHLVSDIEGNGGKEGEMGEDSTTWDSCFRTEMNGMLGGRIQRGMSGRNRDLF